MTQIFCVHGAFQETSESSLKGRQHARFIYTLRARRPSLPQFP